MLKLLNIIFLTFLCSPFSLAQTENPVPPTLPSGANPIRAKIKKRIKPSIPWENSWTTNLWLKASATELQKTPFIADQSPLAMPKQNVGLLLQENFRTQKNNIQWIFRPSVEVKQESYSLYPETGTKNRIKLDARINELFLQKDLNSSWIVAVGLQNYQWGPAELMSPSNPIFHLATDSQDSTYQARGHTMLRLNYSPDGDWSFVSLFEFARNEEKDFIAGQDFSPKGLIKAEYRLPTATDYLGVSIGNEQMHDPFIGEYGNFTFDETFSVYFDIKHTAISRRYFPHTDYGQVPRMNLYTYHGSVYMLGVVGFRVEMEDFDFRWEEISNELGFSSSEIEQIGLSMSPLSPTAEQNQERFLYSGRELISKNYSYLSLRFPNLIRWLDSALSARVIQSHRDETGQATLNWEGTWRDNWTFFTNAQAAYGKKDGEMTLLYKGKLNTGIKYTW